MEVLQAPQNRHHGRATNLLLGAPAGEVPQGSMYAHESHSARILRPPGERKLIANRSLVEKANQEFVFSTSPSVERTVASGAGAEAIQTGLCVRERTHAVTELVSQRGRLI